MTQPIADDAPIAFERADIPRDAMARAIAGLAIAEAAALMPDSILSDGFFEASAHRRLAPTVHPENATLYVQPGGTMPMLTLTTTHPDGTTSSIALLNGEETPPVDEPTEEPAPGEPPAFERRARRRILALTTTLRVTLQAALNSDVSATSATRRAEARRVLDAIADAALAHVPDGHGIDVLAATPWAPASIRSRTQGDAATELPDVAIPSIDAPAILARFPMIDIGISQASGTALYIGPGDACIPGTDDPIERMRRARRTDKALAFLHTLAQQNPRAETASPKEP